MKNRRFVGWGLAACGGAALLVGLKAASALPAKTPARSPNVVVIFVDDLGYNDLGCFGSRLIKTPRLDRMAAQGMKFTDFYVASSVCTPSRAALLTGCYPQRIGMGTFPADPVSGRKSERVLFPNSGYGLNPDEVTLAELLRGTGYATACVGKWHLGDAPPFLPTRHGFDTYFGIPYSNDMNPVVLMQGEQVVERSVDQAALTERYTHEATRFIRRNRDRPFFLYLAHTMPHTPLHASERFRGKSAGGLYGDVVEALDWSAGQVLDTLAELKIDGNTLVVFTSDNGPWLIRGEHGGRANPLRSGKGTTYEGGMRVPCIMRWPGKIPAGAVCSEVVTAMDLLPTVAAITGAPLPPKTLDGKNVLSLLRGEPGAKSPHEAFFYYSAANSLNAVRSGRWKLKFQTTLQEELTYGRVANPDTPIPEALYDLETDPGEQKSLFNDHPEIVARLRALGEAARRDLGDARTGVVGQNVRPIGRIDPAAGANGAPSARP